MSLPFNASDAPRATRPGHHLPQAAQAALAAVVSCVVVLTVAANVLVVVAFGRYRQLRGFNQYFILSLAVSDLLVGCVDMPLYGSVFILGYWPFGEILCDVFVFCDHAFSHFSVMSAVVISLDRFVALTKPFFHRHRWRTRRNAALLIALTYLVPVLLWLPVTVLWPVFAGGRQVQTDTCQPQYVQSLAASILAPVVFFWLPVTVVVVLYHRVYRSIHRTLVTTRRRRKEQQLMGLRSAASRCGEASAGEGAPGATDAAAPVGGAAPPAGASDEGNFSGRAPVEAAESGSEEVPVVGLENVGFSVSGCEAGEGPAAEETRSQSPRGLRTGPGGGECAANGSAAGRDGAPVFLQADPGVLARDRATARPRSGPPVAAAGGSAARASERKAAAENTRATRMLGFIIAAIVIAWLPWAVLVTVINLCQDCLPESLYAVSVFLGYMNSTLNPFCYAIVDRRFRRAFQEILRRPCGARQEDDPYSLNYSVPMP